MLQRYAIISNVTNFFAEKAVKLMSLALYDFWIA